MSLRTLGTRGAFLGGLALIVALGAGDAFAHGGAYLGPAIPPYPPTTAPGLTPPRGVVGGRPTANPRAARTTTGLDTRRWETWWGYNREDFLPARGIGQADLAPIYDQARRGPSRDDVRQNILPVLLEAAASTDFELRDAAAIAIGKVGDLRELPALEKLLADPQRTVAESAVVALGLLESVDAEARLIAIVSDEERSSRERGQGLIALGLSGGRVAREYLTKGLGEPIGTRSRAGDLDGLRALALGLLERRDLTRGGEASAPSAMGGHLQRVLRSSAVADRTFAPLGFHGLAKTHDRNAETTVLFGLRDPKTEVRASAAIAAGRTFTSPDERTATLLVRMAEAESDGYVQRLMVMALGRMGGPIALDSLARFYGSNDRQLRSFAILALGIHRDAKVSERFRQALVSEGDHSTKAAYAIALGLKRDADSVPVLVAELDRHEDPELRESLVLALGMIGDPLARAPLEKLLTKTKVANLQAATALSLGVLGVYESKEVLVQLLRDNGPITVKAAAAAGLGRLGDHRLIAPLTQFVRDESQQDVARAFGVVALGILGEKNPSLPPFSRLTVDANYNLRVEVLDLLRDLL